MATKTEKLTKEKLEEMSVKSLKALCSDKGYTNYSKLVKDKLVEFILNDGVDTSTKPSERKVREFKRPTKNPSRRLRGF